MQRPPEAALPPPEHPPIRRPPETVPPVPVDPRPAIQAVVAEYAAAIESRSIARIRGVYPGLTDAQAQGWRQFFEDVNSVGVTLTIANLQVTGDGAEAALTGVYVFENATTRRSVRQPVAIGMSLHRGAGEWRVAAIR